MFFTNTFCILITLKNPTTEKTYDFKVTGIYSSNNDTGDTASMYSKSANKIITGSGVIEQLVADDSTLTTFVINMINIRERKYEIGVFRTIGMSKLKLTMQFVLELLIISTMSLIIGKIILFYVNIKG